jgi:hypothetical protein
MDLRKSKFVIYKYFIIELTSAFNANTALSLVEKEEKQFMAPRLK